MSKIPLAGPCLGLLVALLMASASAQPADAPFVVVLGIGQDGGVPQAGDLDARVTTSLSLYGNRLSFGFAKKYKGDHDYDYFEEDDFYKKYY